MKHHPAGGRDRSAVSSWSATGDEPALEWTERGDLPTFSTIYEDRLAAVTKRRQWAAVALAVFVGGPFAVVGALLGTGTGFSLGVVLLAVAIAPAVEEILKASGALYLAEQRPWLIPAGWTLPVVALAAGLVFAAVENLLYLTVYIENPTPEVIRWRWVAGPLLHGGASLIAGLGVRRMWMRTDRQRSAPRLRNAAAYLIAAVVLHAGYNLTVTVLELTGVVF